MSQGRNYFESSFAFRLYRQPCNSLVKPFYIDCPSSNSPRCSLLDVVGCWFCIRGLLKVLFLMAFAGCRYEEWRAHLFPRLGAGAVDDDERHTGGETAMYLFTYSTMHESVLPSLILKVKYSPGFLLLLQSLSRSMMWIKLDPSRSTTWRWW